MNQELIGISEGLAYASAELVISRVYRKKTSFIGLGLSASICFVLAVLRAMETEDNQATIRLFEVAGLIANRLVLCAFWSIFYVYLAELYPTQVRSIGFGLASASGTIGSAISPYIIYFSKEQGISTWLPPGVIGVLGVAFIVCLPETYGKPMQERIQEQIETKTIEEETNL